MLLTNISSLKVLNESLLISMFWFTKKELMALVSRKALCEKNYSTPSLSGFEIFNDATYIDQH